MFGAAGGEKLIAWEVCRADCRHNIADVGFALHPCQTGWGLEGIEGQRFVLSRTANADVPPVGLHSKIAVALPPVENHEGRP